MKRLALVLGVAVCGLVAVGSAAAATRATHDFSVSSNWAGYAISGSDPATGTTTSFNVASGSWTQPTATCTAGAPGWSAAWVGLGGFNLNAPALEQIGTDADCNADGTATYYAWYELVPAPSIRVRLKIFPGDHMSAVVVVHGTQVILRLRDLTRKTVFTKSVAAPVLDLTSAEWVVEAPSSCDGQNCTVLPLANFGSVAFTGAAAVGDGHTGTLADGNWLATGIELVPHPQKTGLGFGSAVAQPVGSAVPSDLSSDGGSFTVGYTPTPPAPPTPPAS